MRAFRFYFVVASCGAVLMAVEILSSRLLSPHFGNSVYVWGSIISVFLAALSLGYVAGGKLSDRFPSFEALGLVILGAGVCLAALLLWGEPAASQLGKWTGGKPAGTLLATSLLFGLPTIAFGTVSPWAVRLAASNLDRLGHLAGRLYAVSTFGSLAGTLGCTFLLIPFLDLKRALALLMGLTAATALAAVWSAPSRRLLPLGLAGSLLLFSLLSFRPAEELSGHLYRRMTPYQTLEVSEIDGERLLIGDRAIQSLMRLSDGEPARSYSWLTPATLLFQPAPKRALLLGMGSGSVAHMVRRAYPEAAFDFVEIDPGMADVASRYFGFALGKNDRLFIQDARRFLADSSERWDVIFADTYVGASVPFHLATREFFALLKSRLNENGVLAVNLIGGLSEPFSRAMARTLSEEFPTLYVFGAPRFGNVLVFASPALQRVPREELRARALLNTAPLELKLVEIVDDLWIDVDFETFDTPILLDQHAPVERLLHQGRQVVTVDTLK